MVCKVRGFSLLELIIVLAIISILAAMSYPLYQQHSLKTRRALATITLMHLAAALERYYSTHNTYEHATLEELGISSLVADNHYELQIATASAEHFLIQALPLAAQVADQTCGVLSLNELGEKLISGKGQIAECWP